MKPLKITAWAVVIKVKGKQHVLFKTITRIKKLCENPGFGKIFNPRIAKVEIKEVK